MIFFERSSYTVSKLSRTDVGGIRTCTEGHDTSPEVAGVEGHINSGKRNSSKATLQLNVTLSLLEVLGTGERRLDDLAKHFLDLLDGELLGKLMKTQLSEPLDRRENVE